MPTYEVTSPDGKTWEVSAPDGATQEQVLAYAKQNFGAKQSAAKQPERPPLPATGVPGVGETLLIGAGRTFDRVGKGMQQLYYGATNNQPALAALKKEAQSDDRYYKPLQDERPFATGIGESLPSMAIPGGSATTLGANMARMAAAGAIPGALEYGTAGERGARAGLGSAAGASVPILAGVAKTAGSFVEPLFQKGREAIAGRVLNRVAGDDAAQAAARMRSAQPLVPGSMPTAAQVAENGGIAALERSAAAANPEAYTRRAMEQSSARLGALRGVAQTPADLEAAIADRAVKAEKSYRNAFGAGIDVDMAKAMQPQISALMERPSVQSAMGKAKTLAAEASLNFDKMGSVEGLHYLKLALDDMVEEAAKNPTKQRLIKQTAADLQSVLAEIAPEYKSAMERYARLSGPINQMQVGQALLEKARPALADHGALGRESAANYAQALRAGDRTAAQATGYAGATMDKVLTPQQMEVVTNVARDLARKTNAQDLGRGVGSDTFQKLAMQNIAEQSGMPRAVGGLLSMPGVNRATRWLYQDSDQKIQGLLADKLLDPQAAAASMTKAQQKLLQDNPKARQLLEQTLLRAGLLGAPPMYGAANQ